MVIFAVCGILYDSCKKVIPQNLPLGRHTGSSQK